MSPILLLQLQLQLRWWGITIINPQPLRQHAQKVILLAIQPAEVVITEVVVTARARVIKTELLLLVAAMVAMAAATIAE